MEDRKRRISYFYDSDWGTMYYGANHPMKPHRIVMAHHLVLGYGLHRLGPGLDVFTPRRAEKDEVAQFHSRDYVDFLSKVTPESLDRQAAQPALARFNLNEDCPPFSGLWDFCRSYAAASIQGAVRLNHGLCDVAINWAGGLHHAKKAEASGFCYVNDLVLAILELLKYHARVLYIDIDIHHGDGVEEAFYLTDRVMTVSFHRYGDFFFPGTGALGDVGERRGRGYSVNVPLREGVDDATFHRLFKPIMSKVMAVFQPGAVVLQCGADSLGGDRLGCFNLTLDGHAEAVRFVRGFGVPTLVTGGGGYTKTNVARCWANETAALLGVGPLDDALPPNDYLEYYAPRFDLGANQVRSPHIDNANARADVDRIGREVLASLSRLEAAPAVAMRELPPDAMLPEYDASGGRGGRGGDGNVSGFFGAGGGGGGGFGIGVDDGGDGGGDERLGGYGLRHLVVKEGPDDELGFY